MAATAQQSISSTTFTDLGLAPVQIQVLGPGPVNVISGGTGAPTAGTAGYVLQPNSTPVIIQPLVATDHVWASMFGGNPCQIAWNIVLPSSTI